MDRGRETPSFPVDREWAERLAGVEPAPASVLIGIFGALVLLVSMLIALLFWYGPTIVDRPSPGPGFATPTTYEPPPR